MKYLSTLFISCFLLSFNMAAEPVTPTFEWAISAGGTLHDKTRGIACDAEGNIFLTGEYTGTATFGDTTLTSVGMMDFFVAKVDPQGKFLWVRSGGGSKIDRGYAVATDKDGNCYVTGHYQSSDAKFGTIALSNNGDYDIFVAKYDPKGKLLWINTAGGVGYDYGHGIAVDKLGNVFVTGTNFGEGKWGAETFGTAGPAHVFCAKLNTDGKLFWVKTASGKGSSSGHGVAMDNQGNCYIGGYIGGEGTLGDIKLTNLTGRDVLIAKFDTTGKVAWLHEGHGSTGAMIHEITADNDGNVWASGMFKGDLKLADRTVANQGENDMLLTHLDKSGKRLWTKTAGGPGIDYGLGVATDGKGNVVLTGSFNGKVDFDGTTRTSVGASDIPIISFDRSGKQLWYVQAGGLKTDHAYTIVYDGKGNYYLSGACSGDAKFGTHTITNRGSNDVFLAKLKVK